MTTLIKQQDRKVIKNYLYTEIDCAIENLFSTMQLIFTNFLTVVMMLFFVWFYSWFLTAVLVVVIGFTMKLS